MNDTPPNNTITAPQLDRRYSRDELIGFILDRGRFLIDEKARVVKNAFNTSLILFPQDLAPENKPHLEEKIRYEMARTASFMDVTQLNALRHIPKIQSEPPWEQWQLTLGLFLYFEDECNAKKSSTTFLSAMRAVGATLESNTPSYKSEELCNQTKEALQKAGINTPENLAILDEWMNLGSYTISGDRHHIDPASGKLHGIYTRLADMAARCNKNSDEFDYALKHGYNPGIDEAISYAIGNRQHMILNNPYAHAKDSVELYPENIAQHVRMGQESREKQLMELAQKAFTPEEITESRIRQKAKRPIAESILSWFPDAALEMLLHSHQTHTHAEATNVSPVYPEGGIPGVVANKDNASFSSIGARDKRFRVIFSSNGEHQDNAPPTLAHERVAQTALHELMHVAIENLSHQETLELEHLAKKTSQALRKKDPSYNTTHNRAIYPYQWINGGMDVKTQILEQRTLEEVLDFGSRLYDGYQNQTNPRNLLDTMRKEEAICNLYGMIHTEFGNRADQKNPIFHPPEGMEIITTFAEKTNEYFNKALNRARERNHLGLPPPCQGQVIT